MKSGRKRTAAKASTARNNKKSKHNNEYLLKGSLSNLIFPQCLIFNLENTFFKACTFLLHTFNSKAQWCA